MGVTPTGGPQDIPAPSGPGSAGPTGNAQELGGGTLGQLKTKVGTENYNKFMSSFMQMAKVQSLHEMQQANQRTVQQEKQNRQNQ